MLEIKGNLWDFAGQLNTAICITTNGTIKKNGACVMGRGCAREAAQYSPRLPFILGAAIMEKGNCLQEIGVHNILGKEVLLIAFPVKHNWWEMADLALIKQSIRTLKNMAEVCISYKFILPRPGCGNGGRTWEEVKPLLEELPDNVAVISF